MRTQKTNTKSLLFLVLSLAFIFLISNVYALSSTITITDTPIGQIRSDFYGVNTHGYWGSNRSWIGSNLEMDSNATWHNQKMQEAGLYFQRADMALDIVSASETTFYTSLSNNYKNINTRLDTVLKAKESNSKIVFVAGYMPNWLADKTTSYCTLSTNTSCPPTNYTKFGELVVNFLKNVSCDANTCEVEVWNEPDGSFWLNNLSTTNITKSIEYNKLYNATYIAVKNAYPNMKVGGGVTSGGDTDTYNILFNWFSNFSNKIDFVSHHDYLLQGKYNDYDLQLRYTYDWLFKNMSLYNVQAPIYLDEWNVWNTNGFMYNSTLNQTNNWTSSLSSAYSTTLNVAPNNISMFMYQWSHTGNWTSGQFFGMVSEPKLNNTIYASYNITKLFANNHKALNTVLTSSSSDSTVKVVASKDAQNTKYITITNTNTSAFNITINGLTSGYKDVETGVVYPINNGAITILNMPSYGVQTLSSTTYPQISFVSPTPSNASTVPTRNFIINATIDSDNPLRSIIYTWNNTNYSIYDDSLVLYYNFDNRSSLGENDTHVKDISRYGNNGTVIGGSNISWTNNGKYGGAYNFSGNVNYIKTPYISQLNTTTDNLTISLWFNRYSSSAQVLIAYDKDSSNKAFTLTINTGGTLSLQLYNQTGTGNTYTSSLSITNNNWNNVILTMNKTTLNGYLNGNIVYNNVQINDKGIFTQNGIPELYIGSGRGTGNFLNGSLDNLIIYKKILNNNEIELLYRSQLITKLNSSQYNVNLNQTNLNIYGINYNLFINDSSNNINQSNRLIRLLSSINITSNTNRKIINDFFGIATYRLQFSKDMMIDTNNDGILDTYSDYNWNRLKLDNLRIKTIRREMYLQNYYGSGNISNGTFIQTLSLANQTEFVIQAKNKGYKIIYTLDFTPYWLANTSNDYCSHSISNTLGNGTCPPINSTILGNIAVDYLNKVGCDASFCEIEIWNEPDSTNFWMNNVSRSNTSIRIPAFITMYEELRRIILTNISNINISVGALTDNLVYTDDWIKNITKLNNSNTYIHLYPNNYNFDNYINNVLNRYITNCSLNLNNMCNNIKITEININNASLMNDSLYYQEYKSRFSKLYYILLTNKSYENVSINIFTWGWKSDYGSNSQYEFYPIKYTIIHEPLLGGYESPIYNLTYQFTRYAPALGTVYITTNDNSELVQVQVREVGGKQNLIVTNTYNDEQNVTLNCGSFIGNLIDVSSGSLYSCASGSVNLGVLEPYDVRAYTEPVIDIVNGDFVYYNYLNELLFTESGASLIVNYTYITAGGNAANEVGTGLGNNTMWIGLLIMTIFAVIILSFFTKIKPEGEASYY
jgi:hypothetical protein